MKTNAEKCYQRCAMDKKKIGSFLKALREKKGKTQYQVMQDLYEYGLEISDKTIAKWEKGNFPDFDKLAIVAEYYGVKSSDILNGEIYEPHNFEEQYFIVNDNWLRENNADNLYIMRVEQERLIRCRVKELFIEIIKSKSLTQAQNEELNFLLMHFYSVSDYAWGENEEYGELNKNEQIKLLRREIYSVILTMHDSSVEEIYWEIKKYFDFDKRLTFEKDVCSFEDDVDSTVAVLQDLEDWEKDLLLAQVQTQNINHYFGRNSKFQYLKRFDKDYDEERITKEGIKLLIDCGAKLNSKLLGYAEHRYFHFSILERMKLLHSRIYDKISISKYDTKKQSSEYYWLENNLKNRLINLYYALNCTRDKKWSLNEIFEMFISNDSLPKQIILSRYKPFAKERMSEKEMLLEAEQLCPYEISVWNKCKEKETQLEEDKRELEILEERWARGERIDIHEYDEWVGEEKNKLTEKDILSRLSSMTYSQFIEGRNEEMTKELMQNLDLMSLSEIRKRYFPVEVKYEGGEI